MPKYLYPLMPLLMWAPPAPAQGPRLATLTSAAAVNNLSQAEARRGYPVELRLTALAFLPTWLGLFAHDGQSGIFVRIGAAHASMQRMASGWRSRGRCARPRSRTRS